MKYAESLAGDRDKAPGVASRSAIVAAFRHRAENGEPAPTIAELSGIVGLLSSSTVHRHLEILAKRGVINKRGSRFALAVQKNGAPAPC